MRKLISNALMGAGVAAGAIPAVLLMVLSWPDLVSHINDNHGLQHFARCTALAIVSWWLVSWPFIWFAHKILPKPVDPEEPAPIAAQPSRGQRPTHRAPR
jgi:hypothetical protein